MERSPCCLMSHYPFRNCYTLVVICSETVMRSLSMSFIPVKWNLCSRIRIPPPHFHLWDSYTISIIANHRSQWYICFVTKISRFSNLILNALGQQLRVAFWLLPCVSLVPADYGNEHYERLPEQVCVCICVCICTTFVCIYMYVFMCGEEVSCQIDCPS